MASKQKASKSRNRNWTNEETYLFVEVLVDEEYGFTECLERKALKKSANEEVYQEILKVFKAQLQKEHFVELNKKNFGKGGYNHLDIDTKKLQTKYNSLKKKWREIRDRPRTKSGVSPKDVPDWYANLDKVLGDTNTNLENVISDPSETSFVQEMQAEDDDSECYLGDISKEKNSFDDNESGDDDSKVTDEKESSSTKSKILVKPHQKRRVIRSQTQALTHLSGGMNQMIESQSKRHKETIEFERERDKHFLEFKWSEAEKN